MTSLATETVGIPLAYVIVTSLVLWAVIAARGNWAVKTLVICASLLFGILLWFSLTDIQGWPVQVPMPERFEVKWLVVEEPDKKTGREGAVYVWAVTLGESGPSPFRLTRRGRGLQPRIYRLPYSRDLHEQSEMVQEQLRAGIRFFASLERGSAGEGTFRGGRRVAKKDGKGSASDGTIQGDDVREGERPGPGASLQEYYFHELPPARFPEKQVPGEP